MDTFIYPGELIPKVRKFWSVRVPDPYDRLLDEVSDITLRSLLEVSYHATFYTEEARRVGFRLIYSSRGAIEAVRSGSTIRFENPRPFETSELCRLAPATEPSRVSIGVYEADEGPGLSIWGLIDTGSSWQDFSSGAITLRGDLDFGTPLPRYLTVAAMEPGSLSVACGAFTVLNLRGGRLLEPAAVLREGPIYEFLHSAIDLVYEEICDVCGFPTTNIGNLTRVYVQYLTKVLLRMREKNHGGILLVVPDEWATSDVTLGGRLRVKYISNRARARRLLLDSLILAERQRELQRVRTLGEAVPSEVFDEVFEVFARRTIIDAALSDLVNFLAGLSAVDGAVVLTDRFRVLGFGAMVAVESDLQYVRIACDSTGECFRTIPIESYGARHNAAFRLCDSSEAIVAFVVSQDGGVKAVKQLSGDVVLWEDVDLSL